MTDFVSPDPRPAPPPVAPVAPKEPRDPRDAGEPPSEAFPVEWVLVPDTGRAPAPALAPDFFAH
ncbi:MAG: hypothetical protein FJ304_24010 [Planctomycetes bacterium]|nr:hypothetical protein [Planctomycetota bacterium]